MDCVEPLPDGDMLGVEEEEDDDERSVRVVVVINCEDDATLALFSVVFSLVLLARACSSSRDRRGRAIDEG